MVGDEVDPVERGLNRMADATEKVVTLVQFTKLVLVIGIVALLVMSGLLLIGQASQRDQSEQGRRTLANGEQILQVIVSCITPDQPARPATPATPSRPALPAKAAEVHSCYDDSALRGKGFVAQIQAVEVAVAVCTRMPIPATVEALTQCVLKVTGDS